MERCPGCRARLGEDPACSRCGCDLTLVQRAETQADQFLHRALRAWAEGNRHQARACAEASLTLACSPLGQALLKCVTGPGMPTGQK